MFNDFEMEFGLMDNGEAFMQSEPEEPPFDEPEYNKVSEEEIEIKNGILNFNTNKSNTEEKAEEKQEPTSEADDMFDKISVTTYKNNKPEKKEQKENSKKDTVKKEEQKNPIISAPAKENVKEKVVEEIKNPILEEPTETPNIEDDRVSQGEKVDTVQYDTNIDEEYFENMFKDKHIYEEAKRQKEESEFNEYINDNIKDIYTESDIEVLPPNQAENGFYDNKAYNYTQNNYKAKFELPEGLKKALMFVAMFVIVIGIPVIISISGKKTVIKENNTVEHQVNNEANVTNTTTQYITTESYTPSSTSEINTEIYNDILQGNEGLQYFEEDMVQQETINESRFKTLDDLTTYIDLQTSDLYAKEVQSVNNYKQKNITKEVFLSEMNNYIEDVNALNHLLLVNKNGYISDGKESTYNTLYNNLESLMIYGDMAVYECESK